jgi:hypothetical protein
MKKPNILIIIILAVILALAGFWFWQIGFKKGAAGDPLKQSGGENNLPNKFIPQIIEKQINEETGEYSVEIKYPSVAGLADAQTSEEISLYFKDKAEKDENDFKKDVAENAVKEVGAQSQLISEYQVFWYNADFLSFKTETMYYIAGMAHPSTYDSVFNYDIKNKKQLQLDDFFNPNSDYLEALSIKAKEEVKKQLGEYYDEFMASEGTAPKKENYENFLFDKDGLTFIFGQYQVAPYAAGIIFVKILYSDLSGFNDQSEAVKKIIEK